MGYFSTMSEQRFSIGQRWSNTAETDLGIGIVTQVDDRTVSLFFPSAEQLRNYAQASAPLTRLEFHPRDMVETEDGTHYKVLTSHEEEGLLFYEVESDTGEIKVMCESQVQGSSRMPEPLKRLIQGHFEHHKSFSMRLQTWLHKSAYDKHRAKGFMGARVQPIPHQFHIARTVSERDSHRVMLADEVGLGKTIEAGLIAHRELITGKIQRILILVPDSLVHQWLVEMRRRFNMPVRVFDADQCEAVCEQQETDNPFEFEQLVLCSIQFLLQHEKWAQAAQDSPWDLLIVDEAHHLAWQPDAPSPAYKLVEQFSLQAKNLLLLTATPEKEGPESHFAQLHLLDPYKYNNLPEFLQQQAQYNKVADLAEQLLEQHPLSNEGIDTLRNYLPDASSQVLIDNITNTTPGDPASALTLAQRLHDQKGTGRALFRNTRDGISGFPKRQLSKIELPLPDCYGESAEPSSDQQFYPESSISEAQWIAQDPRVTWLMDTLKSNRQHQFLVICHHKDTACALQAHLHFKGGIQCSAFHEDMTLIERDRSAAWFAADEDRAQALICSEIGSEGRNFQFCSRLVMFDLPKTIDQLEQRIGRLDRIGQTQDIEIYTPYLAGTAQQQLLEWYDEGFSAFTKTEASHSVVFEQLRDDFYASLQQPKNLSDLITTTRQQISELHDRFMHGRNRLLELHSKGDQSIQPLLEAIKDADNDTSLKDYLEQVFNAYGVEEEELSDSVVLIRPGSALESSNFPNLPEDGFSATFQRALALGREDIEFISWDHPMVRNAMDLVITTGKGSSVMSLLKNKQIKEGMLLLEALYVVECPSPQGLQLDQILPATPIRLLLDQKGRDISKAVATEALDKQLKRVKAELITPMLKEVQEPVLTMLDFGNQIVEKHKNSLVQAAKDQFKQYWENEKQRLTAMANGRTQETELAIIDKKIAQGLDILSQRASCRLDGLRIMVTIS